MFLSNNENSLESLCKLGCSRPLCSHQVLIHAFVEGENGGRGTNLSTLRVYVVCVLRACACVRVFPCVLMHASSLKRSAPALHTAMLSCKVLHTTVLCPLSCLVCLSMVMQTTGLLPGHKPSAL
jgi:hypothetical protein